MKKLVFLCGDSWKLFSFKKRDIKMLYHKISTESIVLFFSKMTKATILKVSHMNAFSSYDTLQVISLRNSAPQNRFMTSPCSLK